MDTTAGRRGARWMVLGALGVGAVACGKASKKGNPAEFIPPTGSMIAPVCVVANDGQPFTLEGYFGLPSTLSVDEKNQTTLDFFPEGPGRGRAIPIGAAFERDVQVKSGAAKFAPGYRRTKADLDPASFRVTTRTGPVTDKDKVRATVKVEVIQHFQTKAVTACTYRFVEAEKL